jgi:plasmid maintenance system killer protein
MNVYFEDKASEELYLYGQSTDKHYKKLSRDNKFTQAYVRVIETMLSVETASCLSNYSYLHYEQLKGRPESSIRVMNGRVERLIFTEHEGGLTVKLIEIDSNHYGKKR